MKEIKAAVQKERETLIQYRRTLHQIPETGFSEYKTAAFIEKELRTLGLQVKTGIAGTGLLGVLDGDMPGKEPKGLLIRADMDALPITEETGLAFASTHSGFMHACGHDGHMAMVLGAARVLSQMKKNFSGRITFLFQPAEEGPGGAKPMIEEGVLNAPKVDYALGAHLWPALPHGKIGIKPGALMAAMDTFEITLTGKGGHGAMPHLCIDPIDTSAQVIGALQRLVSRKISPTCPAVLTIGSIHGGSSSNIIPDTVTLQGTTRTFDHNLWSSWREEIERVLKGVCSATGARYTLDYTPGYPPTTNNAQVAALAAACAQEVAGEESLAEPEPTMGGEDFSFFLEKTKGAYLFLGTGQKESAPLHNSRFDFNEEILAVGTELFCTLGLKLLSSQI
ncbi:MAG: M20 family metallopeptidase [Desulfobacterales bacterium]|nr:M20 family metallopeptidase [Desulfobacterales bacterium]